MNKEEKSNIKRALLTLFVFSLIAVIPPTTLNILYSGFNESQVLFKTHLKNPVVVVAKQPTNNIVTVPIIVSAKPAVKTKKPKKPKTPKKWVCKKPRKTEIWYGMVKECEWK